jgi:hypothetical protein
MIGRARSGIDRRRRRQSGAALIILTLALLLVLSAYLLGVVEPNRASLAREAATERALAEAKAALIAYAVTSYEQTAVSAQYRFGVLPCPDRAAGGVVPEGEQDGPCGAKHTNAVGRLPWRTLGIAPVRDGANQCLWYVVSGGHKQNPAPDMRNTDTRGLVEARAPDGVVPLTGTPPGERAVAVVIAPGRALEGQDRSDEAGGGVDTCGGNYTAGNYLDCLDTDDGELCDAGTANLVNNALPAPVVDTVSVLAAGMPGTGGGGASAFVNDRIAIVTRADLEEALLRRSDLAARLYAGAGSGSLLDRVAACLEGYRAGSGGTLPWAAPVDLRNHPVPPNEYRDDAAYDDLAGLKAGRLPDGVDDSGGVGAGVIAACALTAEEGTLWGDWKDHLFYAVAEAFRPGGDASCDGGDCLTVDQALAGPGGPAAYAAVVMFAREPLAGQSRDAPPTDPIDQKAAAGNYLEGRNAVHVAAGGPAGNEDYEAQAPSAVFNDALVCLAPAGGVVPCTP